MALNQAANATIRTGNDKNIPELNPFFEGLASVSIDNKYGYINKNADFIIKPQFDFAGDFKNGMAIIRQGDKYGIIDKTGKYLIPASLDVLKKCKNYFLYKKDGKWGLMSKELQLVMAPIYDFAFTSNDYEPTIVLVTGKFAEKKPDMTNRLNAGEKIIADKYVFVDSLGKEISKLKASIGGFQSRYDRFFDTVFIYSDSKVGIADKHGKIIFPPKYKKLLPYWKNYVLFEKDGKLGVMDFNGKVTIPAEFGGKYECFYHENLVLLQKQGDSFSLYRCDGKLLNEFSLSPDFIQNSYLRTPLILSDIKLGNIQINEKGEIINRFDKKYDVFFTGENLLIFSSVNSPKVGIMDADGNILIKQKYETLNLFDNGLIIAFDAKGKAGVLNLKGEIIVPFNFSCIVESTPRMIFSEGLTFASKENITGGKVDYICGYINQKGNYVLIYDFKTKTFKKVNDNSTLTHEQEHSKQK